MPGFSVEEKKSYRSLALAFFSLSGHDFLCTGVPLEKTGSSLSFGRYTHTQTQRVQYNMMHFTCCVRFIATSLFLSRPYNMDIMYYLFSFFLLLQKKTSYLFLWLLSSHHSDLEAIKINGHSRLSLSL